MTQTEPARNYIDGDWREGDSAPEPSVNPADFSSVGRFHQGTAALADEACEVARRTFLSTDWSQWPRLRAQVLFEIADALDAAKNEIADLCVAENGKLRAEAMGETMGRDLEKHDTTPGSPAASAARCKRSCPARCRCFTAKPRASPP